jgi:hypothetical protein
MIWYREQISIADELINLVPKLREDFLNYHTDYDTTFSKGVSYAEPNTQSTLNEHERSVWKADGLRYVCPDQHIEQNLFLDEEVQNRFPTATELTKKYIDHCGTSGYSSLDPGGVISRHADVENTSQKTVRIHIPLIIPTGDLCFEINGIQNQWSDLFAFDNGQLHSAYNKTNKRRLIYIIDITREFLKL